MVQLSPLRYAGGKSKAVKILKDFIPDDVQSVVSPFFGGGSFENFLALQGREVRGFDLCSPLVDFWVTYLECKDELFASAREMSRRILHPRFHGEIDAETRKEQRAIFSEWKEIALGSGSQFERGCAYFALNRCAFSGMSLIASPMSTVNIEKKFGAKALDNLENVRFAVQSVGYADCMDVIADAGKGFLYLDPPYVMETESKEAIYGKGGDLHRGFNHEALCEVLKGYRGRWVLSYLDVPRIRELYAGCNFAEVTWRYTMKPGGERPQGKELVVTNF